MQWLQLGKQCNWEKASRASQEVTGDIDELYQFCKIKPYRLLSLNFILFLKGKPLEDFKRGALWLNLCLKYIWYSEKATSKNC